MTTIIRTPDGVQTAPALLVVGHGSRDADGVEEFWTLAETIRDAAGALPIDFGFIEMAQPPVDETLDRLVESGARRVVSVPLVLLAAGHLKNDGPAALARARLRHPGSTSRWVATWDRPGGSGRRRRPDPRGASETLTRRRLAVVLVGRGSSDPDANSDLYKLARLLNDGRALPMIEPAFAGVARPDVPAALERCRRLGANVVVVAPFLLFTGALVPRIYERAAQWARDHPGIAVRGAEHLGPDHRLARLVLERYREVLEGDVRMNCDLCTYRVRLPGYEDKLGMPISLTPHGDTPARGKRRARRSSRAPAPTTPTAPRAGLRPVVVAQAAHDSPPAVAVSHLSYTYPDGTTALSDVSFSVAEGERVAILGANGAGKTTLLLHLNGMLEGGTGEIRIGEVVLDQSTRRELRKRVGIVFQDSDDQLFMPTVEADVAFGPGNLGLRDDALRARVAEALDAVRLADQAERAPHLLSAGQRRRAAVAGVLAMHPDVLVLDEPSSHLDPSARRELVDVLRSLRLTTLLVTHDLPYALELCQRAIILSGGAIAADGPTRELLADEGFMRAHRLELPAGFNPWAA